MGNQLQGKRIAFLVANADGDFDGTEQAAFEHVVVAACRGAVDERQVSALLADLHDQLEEDGMGKRIQMVARTISREDHAREVLRVSSLLAHVSGGVSAVERDVLGVGVETVGTDAGRAATFDPPFPNHYVMHGSGKFGLAGLCNLDQVPPTGAVVIAAPLKIVNGSGSPLRVIAITP